MRVYQASYAKLGQFAVSPYTWHFFHDETTQNPGVHSGVVWDTLIKAMFTIVPVLPVLTMITFALAAVSAICSALSQLILLSADMLETVSLSIDPSLH